MPVWGQGALLGDTSLLPALGAPQRSPTMMEKAKARSAGATTAAAMHRHHATTHTQQRHHMTHNMRTSTAKEHMQMSIAIGCS